MAAAIRQSSGPVVCHSISKGIGWPSIIISASPLKSFFSLTPFKQIIYFLKTRYSLEEKAKPIPILREGLFQALLCLTIECNKTVKVKKFKATLLLKILKYRISHADFPWPLN